MVERRVGLSRLQSAWIPACPRTDVGLGRQAQYGTHGGSYGTDLPRTERRLGHAKTTTTCSKSDGRYEQVYDSIGQSEAWH